jgi:Icc-related predicted phosphoesterase
MGLHKGIDQSVSLNWLHKIVDKAQPEVLVGLGDWGYAWKLEDWEELLNRIKIHTVYGNHDNFPLLKSLRNSNGLTVLAEDGEIREIGGLRFGFINGIINEKYAEKEGVPRKTSLFFVQIAECLRYVNVLCTHESPVLPDYGDRITRTVGTEAARKAVEVSQPDLAVSGHLHLSCAYTVSSIGTTTVVRIDSSQQERYYAIIEPEKQVIQILNDSGTVLQRRFLGE